MAVSISFLNRRARKSCCSILECCAATPSTSATCRWYSQRHCRAQGVLRKLQRRLPVVKRVADLREQEVGQRIVGLRPNPWFHNRAGLFPVTFFDQLLRQRLRCRRGQGQKATQQTAF